MPKNIKSKRLDVRLSDELYQEIVAYTTIADITMGEYIRRAAYEYLWAHPLEGQKYDPQIPETANQSAQA